MQVSKKASKKFKQFFLNFDRFGKQANLKISSKDTHQTIIGSIMSIIILAFVIYTFIDLFLTMINHQNPNVIQTIEFTKDPQRILLEKDKYLFALSLTSEYSEPVQQSENYTIYIPVVNTCYRSTFYTEDGVPSYETSCNSTILQRCSEQVLNKQLISDMSYNDKMRSITYCIPEKLYEQGIILQGFGQSDHFYFITFEFYKCNEQQKITNFDYKCAPKSIIEKTFKTGFLGIIFSDRLINQKQIGNPYNVIGKTYFYHFGQNQQKFVNFFLRHSFMQTIENFYYYFFSKTEIYHELQIEKIEDQSIEGENDLIGKFNFILDDKKIIYYRTYDNIITIFGNIGGLSELMFKLVSIIIDPISQLSLDLLLVNSIFSFEKKDQEERNSLRKIIPRGSLNTIMKSKIDVTGNPDNQLIFLKKFFKFKVNGLKLTIFDYIITICGGQRKKIIAYGANKVNKKLDTLFIIKKLIEIDKLKMLLLTKDQIKLFEYLPKPKIMEIIQLENKKDNFFENQENENKPINLLFKEDKTFVQTVQDAFGAYHRLKNQIIDPLSNNLLNLIDRDLKQLFEEQIQSLFYIIFQFYSCQQF